MTVAHFPLPGRIGIGIDPHAPPDAALRFGAFLALGSPRGGRRGRGESPFRPRGWSDTRWGPAWPLGVPLPPSLRSGVAALPSEPRHRSRAGVRSRDASPGRSPERPRPSGASARRPLGRAALPDGVGRGAGGGPLAHSCAGGARLGPGATRGPEAHGRRRGAPGRLLAGGPDVGPVAGRAAFGARDGGGRGIGGRRVAGNRPNAGAPDTGGPHRHGVATARGTGPPQPSARGGGTPSDGGLSGASPAHPGDALGNRGSGEFPHSPAVAHPDVHDPAATDRLPGRSNVASRAGPVRRGPPAWSAP
jgi:hypothetical protein